MSLLFGSRKRGSGGMTCAPSLRDMLLLAVGCSFGLLTAYFGNVGTIGHGGSSRFYSSYLRPSAEPQGPGAGRRQLPSEPVRVDEDPLPIDNNAVAVPSAPPDLIVTAPAEKPAPPPPPAVEVKKVPAAAVPVPQPKYNAKAEPSGGDLEPMHLFLAWVGTSNLPYPELGRVLTDIVRGTAPGRDVNLHLMVQDVKAAATDAQLTETLSGVATTATARRVCFSHLRYDFASFKAASPYYTDLCNDFQGNIHHQNAKEYACQFLIKPLLFEIITEPSVRYVIAIDTDLRIAGDLFDVVTEARPKMLAKGAGFALVAEQQPTYSFNSPQGARGFNGGIQVVDVTVLRASELYKRLVKVFHWTDTDPRWRPATDLGDQTLYSIFNFSNPQLFVELGCHWNRQLCRTWFIIFNERTPPEQLLRYEREALCAASEIRVLHGNCRSQRPGSEELEGLPDSWQERNAIAEAHMLGLYKAFEARVRALPPPAK